MHVSARTVIHRSFRRYFEFWILQGLSSRFMGFYFISERRNISKSTSKINANGTFCFYCGCVAIHFHEDIQALLKNQIRSTRYLSMFRHILYVRRGKVALFIIVLALPDSLVCE